MKIVVTDGGTLNPGDLVWDELLKLGECEIYSNGNEKESIERCRDADIVVINKVKINKAVMDCLPKLKMVSVTATGYDVVDTKEAAKRGIVVTNVPEYGTKSVAQMVFALLLELCHHVGYHSKTVFDGKWSECSDFCYWDKPLLELDGLCMGILGCGRIGRGVAKIANAFGMKVIGYDPYISSLDSNSDLRKEVEEAGIEIVTMDQLFEMSDVVSLHCPLTENTRHLVDKECLSKMKKSSFILNTSRGPLVDEQALADALNNGDIAGAGLDVLSVEPPSSSNPLFNAKNCYITPHIAWATRSARSRLMTVAIDNVRSYIEGCPKNVVS